MRAGMQCYLNRQNGDFIYTDFIAQSRGNNRTRGEITAQDTKCRDENSKLISYANGIFRLLSYRDCRDMYLCVHCYAKVNLKRLRKGYQSAIRNLVSL